MTRLAVLAIIVQISLQVSEAAVVEGRNRTTDVILKGYEVDSSQLPSVSYDGDSLCACRRQCQTSTTCVSFEFVADVNLCKHYEKVPSVVEHTGANTFLHYPYRRNEMTAPEQEIVRRKDGMYYFYSVIKRLYPQAKHFCKKWPGFRPINIITQTQYEVAVEIQNEMGGDDFFIDLKKAANGDHIWGRGKIYETSTLTNTGINIIEDGGTENYHFYSGGIHDDPGNRKERAVCQANLDGISWNLELT